MMRIFFLSIAIVALSACTPENERQAGKNAHELAVETKEAAKKADRELNKAAKEVREGWKESQHEDRDKDKK